MNSFEFNFDWEQEKNNPLFTNTMNPALHEEEILFCIEPPLYDVILLKDQHTSQDCLRSILTEIFHNDHEEANELLQDIQKNHQLICGTYTREVAETIILQTSAYADQYQQPVKCVMQKGQ